ncbi:MAG TPA: hypothetical protein DIW81_09555 [Planctomycetaceae bacterium]|nr:hypothetical protein [Rubinisphaera sp.]HCS51822.1 hypothetical protein [Planctomycetaceae bacterium]
MNVDMFFEHFGDLINSPNGVSKVRSLILEMAVQGRLLDATESSKDSAQRLIESIALTRQELIQKGDLKASKRETSAPKSTPFPIPKNWNWSKIGYFCSKVGAGSTPLGGKKTYVAEGIPFLRSQNVWNTGLVLDGVARIPAATHDRMSGTWVQGKDILVNITGASIGRSCVVPISLTTANVSQHVSIVRLLDDRLVRFIHLCIISPYFQRTIMEVQVGVSREGLSIARLKEIAIPIPPVAEQEKIVAKVDELMALCDELEVRQQERRAVHVRLNTAALDRLTAAETEPDFQTAWTRLQKNFDTLYTLPENVQALRQTILQLAVMGKLVPQDDRDEPADNLLNLMRKHRDEHKAELKGVSVLSQNTSKSEERLTTLPKGWVEAKLSDFGVFFGGGTPSKQRAEFWKGRIPWVSPKDMKVLTIGDARDHVTPEAIEESSAKLVPSPSLLMVVRGMILLHSFPVAITSAEVTINQDMKALFFAVPEVADYLLIACRGMRNRMLSRVERSSHGTCRIPTDEISNFTIPLPPLSEQKRIASKVNRLMAICDQLEKDLVEQTELSGLLSYATIESVLGQSSSESLSSKFGPVVPITCEIINRRRDPRRPLGRTKLAKLQYMVQHRLGIDLGITFERHAHGPLWTGMFPLINTAMKEGWFTYEEPTRKGHTGKFTPGENIQPQLDACPQIIGDKQAEFDELLNLFDTLDTKQAELLTTLYAILHDFKKAGKDPSEEEIIEDFYNWHEEKKKFNRKQVAEMLTLLKQDGIL